MTEHDVAVGRELPQFTSAAGDTEQAAIRRDYLRFLTDVAARCGDIGTYLRAGQPVVLINSPDLVQRLLINHVGDTTKGDLQHTAFRALLGDSISLSEGDRHRMLRRLLAPVLTRRQVSRYAGRITRTAETFCAAWPSTGELDLFGELHRLTLHTLGRTLIAEPELWDEHGLFWNHREQIWEWITGHAGQGRRLAATAGSPHGTAVSRAIADAQAAIDSVIARRACTSWAPADLLADILAANQSARFPLCPREVRDQVLALLFATHETSACTLFWSLYLLDHHPDHRLRVENELTMVLNGRPLGAGDLPALPYTALVLKEAMRLYPPAGRQFRVTTSPISLGGYAIPAGTPLTMCQYLLHRDAGSFPDPSRFAPERFSAPSTCHPLSYLPFGAGERICLGRHYAMLETQLLLALLVSRFRFTFPDSVRPQLAVTLRPHRHPHVTVQQRDTGHPHLRNLAGAGTPDRVESPGSQAPASASTRPTG